MKQNHLRLYFLLSGFLFILDQFLKYLAFHNQSFRFYIIKPWLGWEYFANPGIAFGLPVPQLFILILTPLILSALTIWWLKNKNKTNHFYLGVCLIFAGALSNLIDRIVFSITIDYFRVLTSVMNLADITIVMGAILLLYKSKKSK
ncbi:MAG: signal peptidase II [Patescibacteria group bacterium]|nr:signal peptidase II [Patescibacteria group bacterium]